MIARPAPAFPNHAARLIANKRSGGRLAAINAKEESHRRKENCSAGITIAAMLLPGFTIGHAPLDGLLDHPRDL